MRNLLFPAISKAIPVYQTPGAHERITHSQSSIQWDIQPHVHWASDLCFHQGAYRTHHRSATMLYSATMGGTAS